MNKYSKLCNFLSKHNNNWEDILNDEYHIKTKRDNNLVIFNYNFDCDFSNELVQEARGIIINIKTLDVVCWPFRKFGNYNESYADNIDWNSCRVTEKIDGSIIKLWFNNQTNCWQFSTNSIIDAKNANIDINIGSTYLGLIESAINYNKIPFDSLNKDNTYIFELVSPLTKIVINYPETMLYHIGTRNNLTGLESNESIGIIKPKEFKLSSIDECITAALYLNKNEKSNNNEISDEGFVVVDKDYNRIKVKSPDYIAMHHLKINDVVNKEDCINMLINDYEKYNLIIDNNPTQKHILKYYEYKLNELLYRADRIAALTRNLYKEYNNDRKAVALIITKHELSFIGFKSINNSKLGRELLLEYPINFICKYIPKYIDEDIYKLFNPIN